MTTHTPSALDRLAKWCEEHNGDITNLTMRSDSTANPYSEAYDLQARAIQIARTALNLVAAATALLTQLEGETS